MLNGAFSDPGLPEANGKSLHDVAVHLESHSAQEPCLQFPDLFKVIFNRLHPLYAIDCGILVVYDKPVSLIEKAYVSYLEPNASGNLSEFCFSRKELSPIQKCISGLGFPILRSSNEWVEEFGENHKLINDETEYRYHCYLPLEVHNEILGTLELHNRTEELSTECLAFCSNIADLFSEVIFMERSDKQIHNQSDIPKKDVIHREHVDRVTELEQSFIQLVQGISRITDKHSLVKFLTTQLKSYLNTDDISIMLIDRAEKHQSWYTSTVEAGAGYIKKDLLVNLYAYDDVFMQNIEQSGCTTTFSLNPEPEEPIPPYLEFWRINNFMIATGCMLSLASGHEAIIWTFERMVSESRHQSIEKGLAEISDCLGMALSNLRLSETIRLQQFEIEACQERLIQDVSEETETGNTQYEGIIGSSHAMKRVFTLMNQVAASESTVLIQGETGTGKEKIADNLHKWSPRTAEPLIKVNCAAIPPNLIESELFGHEKGAFTGASDRRIGKFELAHKGTLFLDEIGELSLDLQVKLLRALQEKEIERVGGKSPIQIDVRVVSATNRDLHTEVEAGRFRRDLFYRLNVFPIALPALRNRKEDIPLLATHFVRIYAKKLGKQIVGLSQRALQQLSNYSWPGNVRELEHLIERHVLLAKKNMISEVNIPRHERIVVNDKGVRQKVKTIDENERDHIFSVLQLCRGRISGPEGAAKLLGVPATTLNSKIKRLGLAKKHF